LFVDVVLVVVGKGPGLGWSGLVWYGLVNTSGRKPGRQGGGQAGRQAGWLATTFCEKSQMTGREHKLF
jgi:hypothetical protein